MTTEAKTAAAKKVVSVVIGSYNRRTFLKLTIESVRRELDRCALASEIIVVDGGSGDGTLPWLMKQKDIITIVQHNRGEWRGKRIERRSWGYFMNLGFKCAQGKYVCMLSDDSLVVPGAIRNGVRLFEDRLQAGDQIGAVAFYWRNWPEQTNYSVGLTLGDKMFVNHGLYLKDALAEVGYVDEESFHFYHADGDLCLKMWQNGYACIDSPDSYVEHYYHATADVRKSNLETQKKDHCAYLEKWEGIFYDPVAVNMGGWIEKEFSDNLKTADLFKRAAPFNCHVKRNALKMVGPFLDKHRGKK
ncbi:glycosyltransferase [Geomonas propionica]|uniref:Glycosyltransferase n=1 Tax=Geomonas propionica TaxID=2798582 RepID=A0ABS0YMR9_9BACT|nr:glycosyltransferase [Geomonas propionica]MBJ6799242.1 glycosyltransferase [Geomonas propionica]